MIQDIPEGWRYIIISSFSLFASIITGEIAFFIAKENNKFQMSKYQIELEESRKSILRTEISKAYQESIKILSEIIYTTSKPVNNQPVISQQDQPKIIKI